MLLALSSKFVAVLYPTASSSPCSEQLQLLFLVNKIWNVDPMPLPLLLCRGHRSHCGGKDSSLILPTVALDDIITSPGYHVLDAQSSEETQHRV